MTPRTPTLGGGAGLRTYAVTRALAAWRPVDVVYAVWGEEEPPAEFRALADVRLHPARPTRGLRRAARYLRARLDGVPHSFSRGISAELRELAEAQAAAPGRQRVVADGPIAAAALARLARRQPVIYCAHNLESGFRHAAGATGIGSPAAFAAFERRLLEAAAETWMVSERDVQAARELAPGAEVRCVPNAIDVRAIRPLPAREGGRRAVLVADYAYPPNRQGVDFLLDEVFPRVWDRLPDARLALIGRDLHRRPDDPRVEALGFVEDLPAEYARAACALVPLLEGGGSPLKFIEALAYGLPVVATPAAARGLEGRAGEHYVEGSDGPSFADAVVTVLERGAADVARGGRELAERRYSLEALTEVLRP